MKLPEFRLTRSSRNLLITITAFIMANCPIAIRVILSYNFYKGVMV